MADDAGPEGLTKDHLYCGALYDNWVNWGASWERDDYLIVGALAGSGLLMLFWTLWTWLRWYRPRRVRDMTDLAKVLP